MLLPLQIARRFLWRSKVQSALIVLGIGVGIGTQVFVGSLINSLQASLLQTTVGTSAHVTLTAERDGEALRIDDELAARLDDATITAVVPQHRESVLARVGDGAEPLVLRIMQPDARDHIYDPADPMVVAIVDKMVKQRKDSIAASPTGGRTDLADKEAAEIKVLEVYLPQRMGADEVAAEVKAIVAELGAKGPGDMGKVMGVVKTRLAGKADMGQVSAAVKAALTGA